MRSGKLQQDAVRRAHFGLICVVAMALVISVRGPSYSAEAAQREFPDRNVIARFIQPLVEEGDYVGIEVAVVDASGSRNYGFGTVNRELRRQPSGDTVFALASVTKTFTGVLLADFARRGIVRLDDPISRYLPPNLLGPNNPLGSATLLDLATHMSGLPKGPPRLRPGSRNASPKPLSTPQLYKFLADFRGETSPETEFRYSNIGVALLGNILERVSGKSYETLVEELICKPLGMTSTGVRLTPDMRRRLAQGYNKDFDPTPLKEFDVGKSSGGLYSTAHDMTRYLAAHLGLLDASIVPAIMEAERPLREVPGKPNASIGLTWQIHRNRGLEIVSKNGGIVGYQSFVAFAPKARIGVIALANTSRPGRRIDSAARKLLWALIDSHSETEND
jgi:serine-type D-Ala-D-Ala carboxypeptidase/endopeptidase